MLLHLIVDCTPEDVGVAASFRTLLGGAPACIVHAPTEELPRDASEWASILVTGSPCSVLDDLPWLPALLELLRSAAREGVPVLGVCFGHQVLARALGGPKVVRASQSSEIGWTLIERRAPSQLLAALPARFPSFVSHFDEVVAGPELVVLARSERCAVQAFRARERPMWGVQFHPELPPGVCAELVRAKVAAHGYRGEDPDPVLAEALDVRPVGRVLFATFLRLAEIACGRRRRRRRAG